MHANGALLVNETLLANTILRASTTLRAPADATRAAAKCRRLDRRPPPHPTPGTLPC